MPKWEWCLCAPIYGKRCTGCTLLLTGNAEVIHYGGGHYHVGCLLNYLLSREEPAKPVETHHPMGALWP